MNSPLFSTPPELRLEIFGYLDCGSLLTCKQVCRTFKHAIDHTITLQYAIELFATGNENNRYCSLSPAVRLEILKSHANAWDELKWNRETRVPMQQGGLWELYGGVLAQTTPQKSFTFYKLPSDLRSIEEKTWTIGRSGLSVRDFGIDPSQDLLVLIEKPRWSGTRPDHAHRLYLLSLLKTPGDSHPLASGGSILSHVQDVRGLDISYTLQISGEYIGILASSIHAGLGQSELMVWNWKTGQLQLDIYDDQIRSFAFLTHRHIIFCLLSVTNEDEDRIVEMSPTLMILDFVSEGSNKKAVRELGNALELRYPRLDENVGLIAFEIRSDPAPAWMPGSDTLTPFHVAKDNKLFVVTLWVQVPNGIRCLVLFVPLSTLTTPIHAHQPSARRVLTWEEWGPEGTRMVVASHPHSHIWVCYVYGSKYVVTEEPQPGARGLSIRVHDFNQVALRRGMAKEKARNPGGGNSTQEPATFLQTVYQIASTIIPTGEIFEEDVETCLPYRWRSLEMDLPPDYKCAVMCNEDNLIIVDSNHVPKEYRILTF